MDLIGNLVGDFLHKPVSLFDSSGSAFLSYKRLCVPVIAIWKLFCFIVFLSNTAFLKSFIYFFIYVYVYVYLCMYVCRCVSLHVCMCVYLIVLCSHGHGVPTEARSRQQSSRNWACRSLLTARCGCWEWNPGPLQEQQECLHVEPSLQPHIFALCYFLGRFFFMRKYNIFFFLLPLSSLPFWDTVSIYSPG